MHIVRYRGRWRGKDGSGCANLTGESGGGGEISEKGVSERLLLRSGAAVRGCDRRNRSPRGSPPPPGWGVSVCGESQTMELGGRGEGGVGERSGEDATCAVFAVSPRGEAVDCRCRVGFIVNIEDATALHSGGRPPAAAALFLASGACAGQRLRRMERCGGN